MTLVTALPDLPQSIFTGHVPGFVFDPIVQVIFVAAPSPRASDVLVE